MGYKVAFNVLQDQKADDYELYTIGTDGKGIANVTNNKDVAWTHYSTPGKLPFINDRGACKMDSRVRYQLFTIDRATGRFAKLTNEPTAAFRDHSSR